MVVLEIDRKSRANPSTLEHVAVPTARSCRYPPLCAINADCHCSRFITPSFSTTVSFNLMAS